MLTVLIGYSKMTGVDILSMNNNGGSVTLDVDTADKLFSITGTDGAVAITALQIDMSDEGKASFNKNVNIGGNLDVTGDLTIDGSITLGDAAADTITTNAIIADDTLKMQRDEDGDAGFNLVIEKSSASAENGDTMGTITFQMNNSASQVGNEDAIQAKIEVRATDVSNSSERNQIVFSTASGTATTTEKFTISDELTAKVDLVSDTTNTIGQSGNYWSKAYITDTYGDLNGNVKDSVSTGYSVVSIGSDNPQYTTGGRTPVESNFSVFYGRVVGPIEGNAESATLADTVETGSIATNADHYLTFVTTNHATRTGSDVYTDSGIKYNPSTDKMTIGGVLDITDTTAATSNNGDNGALRVEGGASIAGTVYAGAFNGGLTGNVTGEVSSLANQNTDAFKRRFN